MNFCEYLKASRKKHSLTLVKAAHMMGISSSYLSTLENGTRPAPKYDVLKRMADVLELSAKERHRLFDLAAESKQPPVLADDLNAYIYQIPQIRSLMRYAMECGMTEKDWDTVDTFVRNNYLY